MLRVPSQIQAHQFESLKIHDNTFVAYRSDVYPSKNDVYFEDNAVIYVLEGDKNFSNDKTDVKVQKGDILFVKRGFYLMNENIDVNYQSLVFFLDEKLLKDFINQHLDLFKGDLHLLESPLEELLKLESNEAFQKYVESLRPYFKLNTDLLPHFLRLKLYELLLHLLALDQGGQLAHLLFEIYKGQALDLKLIVENYCLKPLTIKEIAKISGRSLSVFKRDFEQIFGAPPGKYLRERKLNHAAFLLKNNMSTVEETAEILGFDSVSHFIKAFKLKFNKTPKQFS